MPPTAATIIHWLQPRPLEAVATATAAAARCRGRREISPIRKRSLSLYLLQLRGQRLNLFLVRLLSLVGLTSEG